MASDDLMHEDLMLEMEATGARLIRAREMIARKIVGQQAVVEQTLIAILCGGHGLLVGAPGLAKTRLVETLGTVLGLVAHRIQFTPDLMPADILGAEVLETGADGTRAFRFIDGPIFCQLLMGDEINRASPRTQSALLQAMQEHEVSVAGQRRILPAPFHVLATQNPIEQEGTYPLPEAQLDRFLLQIDVEYPGRDDEREIILSTTGVSDARVEPVFDPASLIAAQKLVRRLPVGESVVEKILDLVRSARPGEPDAHPAVTRAVSWGPGPRAAQALMLAIRARALIQGRLVPDLDDVAALARPVLIHRMALGFAARAEGQTLDAMIARLVADVMQVEAAA
jgi:MoxR-like ATPase